MLAERLSIEEVRRLIDEGAGVDRLETVIEHLELDPDERAALWLCAWSNSERRDSRQPVPGLYLG
jgi:thymidylate synthase